MTPTLDADNLIAQACAYAMWRKDRASRELGMEIELVTLGEARVSMTVTDHMTNGHDTCHGGYIFTLADSAFAFACNGYNVRSVAQHCSITYVAPSRLGDRLVADAKETARFGRSGIYDVSVRRADGELIAEMRGHSRTVGGSIVPEDGEAS